MNSGFDWVSGMKRAWAIRAIRDMERASSEIGMIAIKVRRRLVE